MSAYKEFEGKNLDEAIRGACAYYDTTRDKLEIDILNDAKTGIFGLMGTKKARVRARMVEMTNVLEELDTLSDKGRSSKKRAETTPSDDFRPGKRDAREDIPRKEQAAKSAPGQNDRVVLTERPSVAESPALASPAGERHDLDLSVEGAEAKSSSKHARGPRRERSRADGRRARQAAGKAPEAERDALLPMDFEGAEIEADAAEFSRIPVEQLDMAELEAAAREIVSKLTLPFLGAVTISVAASNDRVRISLSDVEDSSLLTGRDGQTLTSLQYLVTRMLSNRMKALLHVQIDAGDYRERQDERLREMALGLAEKVKSSGRPQVTRPLSSYHRRVIHLTLQDDPLIQTHSKGEGEMKRVMVARRKDRT